MGVISLALLYFSALESSDFIYLFFTPITFLFILIRLRFCNLALHWYASLGDGQDGYGYLQRPWLQPFWEYSGQRCRINTKPSAKMVLFILITPHEVRAL